MICTRLSRRAGGRTSLGAYRGLCNIRVLFQTIRHTSLIHRSLCSNAPSPPPPGMKIPGFDISVIPMDFASEIKKVLTEHETDKKWAKTPKAREVLGKGAKMPLPASGSLVMESDVDMSSYSTLRGFTDDADKEYAVDTSAYRTLSAAMTFPLTLGYGIQKIFPDTTAIEDDLSPSFQSHILSQNRKLKVCVLGARAESSLPLLWWREALIYSLAASQRSMCANGLEVAFVGPELQVIRASPLNNDVSTSVMAEQNVDLRIYHYPDGNHMLHAMDGKNLSQILLHSHVFVLFNPGLGHPALTENWKETFSLLLQTKKPILCTAYHTIDLERDIKFVEDITAEIDEGEEGLDLGEPLQWICRPHTNPFASGRRTVDKKEEGEGQIVRTNEFLYALQAK